VHTYFNNQLYSLSNGLSPSDQRARDIRTSEFADALSQFWSERARRRRARRHQGFKRWITALTPTSPLLFAGRQVTPTSKAK